jgi:hypothetical protein
MGKTVFAINKLHRDVLSSQYPHARGHYFAPTYKMAKSISWDYLRQFTSYIPGMKYNRTELKATYPWGQFIQLVGSDNPDTFRGQFSMSVVMDEYALMEPRTWSEVVRPALADHKGSALFIGTPAGRNGFWEMYRRAGEMDNWFRCTLTYKDTGLIDPEEIEAMRQEMEEHEFRQELLCDWQAAVRGAYYGRQLVAAEEQGRIGVVPYDKALPVITSWDLGIADATAVWFAQMTRGGEIRLIDYEEFTGDGFPEIISKIRQKPYTYKNHWAPHDIRVRELGSGVSREQTARKLGLSFRLAPNIPLMDGISATRSMLDRVWIDEKACDKGLQALRLYRSEWDDRKRIYSQRPFHDWTSHAADALRMLAVSEHIGSGGGSGLNYDMLDRMAI